MSRKASRHSTSEFVSEGCSIPRVSSYSSLASSNSCSTYSSDDALTCSIVESTVHGKRRAQQHTCSQNQHQPPCKQEQDALTGQRQALEKGRQQQQMVECAMKNDAFLLSDQSSEVSCSSDSEESLIFKIRQGKTCPCCNQMVEATGTEYHAHLYWCLKSKDRKKKKASEKKVADSSRLLKNVKKTIGKLDLTFRINMMESLYRMSKTTETTVRPHGVFPHMHKEQVDKKVLALVYGNKASNNAKNTTKDPQSQRRKHKRGRLSVDTNTNTNTDTTAKRHRRTTKSADNTKFEAPQLILESRLTPQSGFRAQTGMRQFSPLTLQDCFELPPHAVGLTKGEDDSFWKKSILFWHENNRSVRADVSLPPQPFT